MRDNLLPLEERERRLRVIEDLVKTEGWRVTAQSLEYSNYVAMQEVIDLHWAGKNEEAKVLALRVKAKQEVLKEPQTIIRHTKPLFDEWDWKSKSWVRKIKKIFSREERSRNIKTEEQNART